MVHHPAPEAGLARLHGTSESRKSLGSSLKPPFVSEMESELEPLIALGAGLAAEGGSGRSRLDCGVRALFGAIRWRRTVQTGCSLSTVDVLMSDKVSSKMDFFFLFILGHVGH